MDFVNNWSRPITLAAGAWECPLDLPDGTYRLCISNADRSLFEVVDAAVASGTAALTRGLEGTAAQTWLSGSRITASVTAEMLESFAAAGATWGGITGSLADQADLQAALNSKATSAQGAKADSAVQPGSLAEVATSGSYSDLASKPFIPAAPGDIGAGTAAQGALADTAVQPAALTAGLSLKVDKVAGYGLSQENYTPAEKAKLAALDGNLWKGEYPTLVALKAAHPTAAPGSSANVDAGAGDPVLRYIWDDNDSEWVAQAGSADPVTAAQVKTLYEANPDTNAFGDADKTKLDGIAGNATANPDTDSLSEGATNKWFTVARVLASVLTGLSVATGGAVVETDTVLQAFGRLQKQITDLIATVSGKQDTLVSAANIKTVNGASLLGPGDLTVGGGGTVGLIQVYEEAPVEPPEYQLFMVVIPADTEPPEVTAFTATSGVASPVPITSFTATDNVGVTGYWVGTSSAEPALGDPGWSATPQTSFATASTGSVTLYARARDAAGNISAAVSQVVVIEDAYYDISWPYNSSIHTGLFSVAAGSFTTDSAIPVMPPTAMTIKSVMIPMRRQVEAAYPGTGTVQLEVRSGGATGPVLATATAVVSPSGGVEVKTFTLPSNLSLAAGTTYFFTLSLVSPTGGDALYRILCAASTGSTWSRYNAGAWASYASQSPIRLEKV